MSDNDRLLSLQALENISFHRCEFGFNIVQSRRNRRCSLSFIASNIFRSIENSIFELKVSLVTRREFWNDFGERMRAFGRGWLDNPLFFF